MCEDWDRKGRNLKERDEFLSWMRLSFNPGVCFDLFKLREQTGKQILLQRLRVYVDAQVRMLPVNPSWSLTL